METDKSLGFGVTFCLPAEPDGEGETDGDREEEDESFELGERHNSAKRQEFDGHGPRLGGGIKKEQPTEGDEEQRDEPAEEGHAVEAGAELGAQRPEGGAVSGLHDEAAAVPEAPEQEMAGGAVP